MPPSSQPETPNEHTRDAAGRLPTAVEELKISSAEATILTNGLLALNRYTLPGTDLAKTSKFDEWRAMARKHSDQAKTLFKKLEDLFAKDKVLEVDESPAGVLLHLSGDETRTRPRDDDDAALVYSNGASLFESKDPASRKRRKNDAIDLTEPTHAQQVEYYKVMISSLVAYNRDPRTILDDRCPANSAARYGLKIPEDYILKLSKNRRVALCLLEDTVLHGVVVPCNMVKGIVNFVDGISGMDPAVFTDIMPAMMILRKILRMDRDFGPVLLRLHGDKAKVDRAATVRAWVARFAADLTIQAPEIARTRCAALMDHVRRHGVIATTVLSDEEVDNLADGVSGQTINHFFPGGELPNEQIIDLTNVA